MAYLAVRKCNWSGCGRGATTELYSRQNTSLGHYCQQHGKAALKKRCEYEQPTQRDVLPPRKSSA